MESFDIHSDIQPSDTWLDEHHQVVKSRSGNQGTYDVFAMVTESVFPLVVDGKAVTGHKKISIDFQIIPVTIQLRGWYNTVSGYCEIKAYAKLPLIPQLPLGEFKGNIKDASLKINFGNHVVVGWLNLYYKAGWLRIEFSLIMFGKTISGDIKLIPIVFDNAKAVESGGKV